MGLTSEPLKEIVVNCKMEDKDKIFEVPSLEAPIMIVLTLFPNLSSTLILCRKSKEKLMFS